MRILFLTPELPFPAESGGTIKTASILEHLRKRHEVHVLCFRRRALSEAQARWCDEPGGVETVPLSRGRNPANLARSYLSGLPLSVERNRSASMARLVAGHLGRGYDSVFVDSWLMAQYLPEGSARPALLHEHNAEYLLWQRQADREANPLLRALLRQEGRRVRRYEAAILSRFATVFAVSEADRRALAALGAEPDRLRLLPNLPDPTLLELPPLSFDATRPLLLYFGTLSWQPNVEGLNYFLREVLPLVRQRLPDVSFVIAGRGAGPSLHRLARRSAGVEFLGPVADAEPLYRQARLFVEASHSGGGTRLKLLNALARGLPVVTTPVAAEGLDASAGEHLLIAADATAMSDAIVRLMADDALWRALSENGRRLIRQRYLPDIAYRALDEVLSGAGAAA
ncbi:MAG TPA: glycosyltransferase family 4 protein [Dehalococcoidia bacterium]|nr:glycosyltransferase family 4 protein [Dehalococcoidia bacterium]